MRKTNWFILPAFIVFMLGLGSFVSAKITDDPIIFDPDQPLIGDRCTEGKVKYQPKDSCDFTTNTCCNDGSWSGPDGKCCEGSKPSPATQSCTTGGRAGTQTATYSCNHDTGNWDRGSWGTCTASPECTPGETTTQGCPTYGNSFTGIKPKEKTCGNNGFWQGCQCPASTGNGYHAGKPYCEGTIRTAQSNLRVDEADDSCWYGIWSDTMCSGICCCAGATPFLDSAGNASCRRGSHGYDPACVCQTPRQIQESGYDSGFGENNNW